jgi:hypothetical protein
MRYKRESKLNNQIVARVTRPTDETMLKCDDCRKQFKLHEAVVIDIGNEVDGILLFHQEEKDCIKDETQYKISDYSVQPTFEDDDYNDDHSDLY